MLTRRAWLLGASAGVGAIVGRSCVPTNAPGPAFPAAPTGSGVVLDDASQLSPTRVTSHLTIREDPRSAAVDRLRAALAEARAAGRPFIASAARHSMGGQGLAKDGTVITLDQQWLEPDTAKQLYRVAAGERWSSVISRLDAIGFSPKVMQSNNDFGVASTFSVNAHGWPVPFSGCGSTVRAIAMLLADGSAVTRSRTENAELFQHAMGGYGLRGHHRARARHGAERTAGSQIRACQRSRHCHAASRGAVLGQDDSDGVRADGHLARSLLRRGPDHHLSAVNESERSPGGVGIRLRQPRLTLSVPRAGRIRSGKALPLVERILARAYGGWRGDAQHVDERAG
jgi:hypothetical protein